jgi:hypothetical protein
MFPFASRPHPPPLQLIYMNLNTMAEQEGIKKTRCYWEYLGEHIENLGNIMKTWWEIDWEFDIGTHWEQIKKTNLTQALA